MKNYTSNFNSRSNTKAARQIIRQEMLSYFSARDYGVRSNLDAIRMQVNARCDGDRRFTCATDWKKCKELVNDGCFAVSYADQIKMLSKIYGKQVENWSGHKIHETYGNLIGREYSAMLRERANQKVVK